MGEKGKSRGVIVWQPAAAAIAGGGQRPDAFAAKAATEGIRKGNDNVGRRGCLY